MALVLIYLLISTFSLIRTNGGEPDQTPRSAASDLVLHWLPMSHKK